MTRHQFTRGYLDAVQLRGGVLTRAEDIKPGDKVMFLMESCDYIVEDVDYDAIGNIRHRTNGDTKTLSYEPGEYLYIMRDTEK